ncbi:formiminotransferase-cyclodeaminase [Spirochaetia bacterium]|nr:formiminotransferase-cyclodeaminase [Spirochaetia bacterium]
MKLVEQTIGRYSDLLASDFPTPGGGSTAALNGVLGCSFIAMIAGITVKKAAGGDGTALLQRIGEQAESLRNTLLTLVDEDTEAYNGIMAARSMLQPTDSLRGALKTAVETPFRILQAAHAALDLARSLSKNYYAGTASDLALAALNLEAAARGAYLTVRINLNHLSDIGVSDIEYIRHKAGESAGLLAEAEDMARSIYDEAKALLDRGKI